MKVLVKGHFSDMFKFQLPYQKASLEKKLHYSDIRRQRLAEQAAVEAVWTDEPVEENIPENLIPAKEEFENYAEMSFELILDKCKGFLDYFAQSASEMGKGIEKDDAKQELMLCMWKAMDNYDPGMKKPVSNYLYRCAMNKRNELVRNSKALKRGGKTEIISLDKPLLAEEREERTLLSRDNSQLNLYEFFTVADPANAEDLSAMDLSMAIKKMLTTQVNPTTRRMVSDYMIGLTQVQIAEKYGYSQALVHERIDGFRLQVSDVLRAEGHRPHYCFALNVRYAERSVLAHA